MSNMLDLAETEIDTAVLDVLKRVLERAQTAGWQKPDAHRCILDAALWKSLVDLVTADPDAPAEERPTFLTAALVSEKLGEALVGVPLLDHLVVSRLLERLDTKDARDLRLRAASGTAVFGLFTPSNQTRDAQPAVSLSGAIATSIARVLPDGRIDIAELPVGAHVRCLDNLADLPTGLITENLKWHPLGTDRSDIAELAIAERRTLFAAAIGGMCARAVALATDYAKSRELFGAPIGSFQALAHSLSNAKVLADGVQLLAREAAWSMQGEPERFQLLSNMAYSHAAYSGDVATRAAMHVFGGYGLTREYPVQAYFRTVRALCLFIGDRRFSLQSIGRELIAEKQRRISSNAMRP
jgi:Acyl-CoA dehydrogenase, C-terminal domain